MRLVLTRPSPQPSPDFHSATVAPTGAPRFALWHACVGEVGGTFLLVLFGIGSVAAAVLTGAQAGLWQVAVVWGFGITLAIYATAALSGAHLNPAVSLSFAVFRRQEFPLRRLLPYWGSQLTGAILAALVVLWVFSPFLVRFEAEQGVVRGQPGSEVSAMVFGEYFPNPAMFGTDEAARALVSPATAAVVEGLGTAILVFMIFSLVDRRNTHGPAAHLAPFFIGFTVAVLISLFAPVTQAGWNPARDFGPRLVAYFAGWGGIAIPGPGAGFWVYIAGPLVGGLVGAALYDFVFRRGLRPEPPSDSGNSNVPEEASRR
jgi:glycerol uptake facilitator protein